MSLCVETGYVASICTSMSSRTPSPLASMPATVSGAAGGGTVGRVASAGGEPEGKPYHADHQTDHCTFIPASLLFHVVNFSSLIIPHGSTGDLSEVR